MPDRLFQEKEGALPHDLSMKLGEVIAYIHENRHGVNNLSSKFDGFSNDIRKQLIAVESKIGARVEELGRELRAEQSAHVLALEAKLAVANQRIATLEVDGYRRAGAVGLFETVTKSPVVGWMVGAGFGLWTLATGRLHL